MICTKWKDVEQKKKTRLLDPSAVVDDVFAVVARESFDDDVSFIIRAYALSTSDRGGVVVVVCRPNSIFPKFCEHIWGMLQIYPRMRHR